MKFYVTWIDREHAKVFLVSAEKMERTAFSKGKPSHHTHAHDAFEHEALERRLFEEVVNKVRDGEKVLILGPGVAKHHFRNFLSEQYPAIARKVVACEPSDHPTDAQLASYAIRYFEIESLAQKPTG